MIDIIAFIVAANNLKILISFIFEVAQSENSLMDL